MKYIIGTSDKKYFHWQILLQINNFRRIGIERDTIYLVSYHKVPSAGLKALMEIPSLKCQIKIYPERTKGKYSYASIKRADMFEQFFVENPEYQKMTFMLLDPDVLFIRPIDYSGMLDDDIWYASNTVGYIGTGYVKSKGEHLLKGMCDIVDIPVDVVEANNKNAGGAQWIMKNCKASYWTKCKHDMEALYKYMREDNNKHISKDEKYKPIQAWTADMWALLWNAWRDGVDVRIDDRLSFAWANYKYESLEKRSLFHNAGVKKQNGKDFPKLSYQNSSPFYKDIVVSKESASWFVYEEIKSTEKNFPRTTKALS